MPPFLVRRQQTGQRHFITTSCYNRNPYLYSDAAAQIFEYALEASRQKYQFLIFGYVVMPEHVHLLISEPPTHPLSTVLGALKRSVSKQRPESPFWLPRYYDRNIDPGGEHIEKLRYIHRNPVERGLVTKPEDYLYSSFSTYAFRRQGVVRIEIP
jgi:putative transposase